MPFACRNLDLGFWTARYHGPPQAPGSSHARQFMSGGQYERKGDMETPDVTNCIMEYPMQMNYVSSWSNNLLCYFDRGRYEVTPQRPNNEPSSDSMISGTGPVIYSTTMMKGGQPRDHGNGVQETYPTGKSAS